MNFTSKFFLAVVFFLSSSTFSFSQFGQWVWVKGDTTVDPLGVQGTPNVPAIENNPRSRDNSISWTDHSGNLWLFGGIGPTTQGNPFQLTPLNDLWRYSPSTNMWTRMQPVGVSPSPRWWSMSWTDKAGNLWLFGGFGLPQSGGSVSLNDLWKYTIGTNTWTLMNSLSNNGNKYGVYGTLGIAASGNRPGARYGSHFWTDAAGNFWVFGGRGYGASGIEGPLNDLWKYNTSGGTWTWVAGLQMINGQANYGDMYVPAATNYPGAREYGMSWTDSSNHLWLLGGVAYTNSGFGSANDLWQYDIDSNMWTWVSGENTVSSYTAYGTMGIPSFENRPGALNSAVTWTDKLGNLWLYGGFGNTQTQYGFLNSLWRYTPSTFEWTWLNGNIDTSVKPVYGVQGVPAATNQPGARANSISWTDDLGNFWLFGAGTQGTQVTSLFSRDDLWKINFTIVPVKLISFTGKLQDEHVSLNWTVENEENFDHYEIERSSNGINFSKVEQVKARGIKNYDVDDNISELQEEVIYYRLKMMDIDGKYTYSKVINFHIPVNVKFNLSPNPANDFTRLTFSKSLPGKMNIEITDATGRIVFKNSYQSAGTSIVIPIHKLPNGNYAITVVYNEEHFVRSLSITR